MPPLLAASDFDPFQIAIIGIALLASFLKWLWENWRTKSDAAQRDFTPPDPEEQRLRDEAWRRQMGQGSGTPVPPQPTQHRPSAPPVASSSWDELRKAWNELKDAARQGQNQPPLRPTAPVEPLRQPQARQQPPPRRGSVAATLSAAEAKLAAARDAATAAEAKLAAQSSSAAASFAATPVVERRGGNSTVFLGGLQNLRHDPALLRQAILLHEILGPPKALQSSTDPAN